MATKKKKIPSMSQVRRALMTGVFDPRQEETPLRVIVTTAGRDYHTNRALEMIREATDALELNNEVATYHEKMGMALSLLGLAICEAPPMPVEA